MHVRCQVFFLIFSKYKLFTLKLYKMSKATATLQITFSAGDCIEGAFEESIRLAKLLNVWVEFNFNGVTCFSQPKGNVETGVESYRTELKRKEGSKLAFS